MPARGWGKAGNIEELLNGYGALLGVMKYFGTISRWWLHNTLKVLNTSNCSLQTAHSALYEFHLKNGEKKISSTRLQGYAGNLCKGKSRHESVTLKAPGKQPKQGLREQTRGHGSPVWLEGSPELTRKQSPHTQDDCRMSAHCHPLPTPSSLSMTSSLYTEQARERGIGRCHYVGMKKKMKSDNWHLLRCKNEILINTLYSFSSRRGWRYPVNCRLVLDCSKGQGRRLLGQPLPLVRV